MIVFFIIFIASIAAVSIIIWVGSSTNKEMTINHCPTYRKGTFKDFIYEYKKYGEWARDEDFPESHFSRDNRLEADYHIHAGIIKFDSVGMILSPFGYLMLKSWTRDNSLEKVRPKYQGKWRRS